MSLIIEINLEVKAAADKVWQVINDLQSYPAWNPFVVSCRSTLKPGDPIHMRVKVLPFFAQPQTETVFENRPGEILSYGIQQPLGSLASIRSHEVIVLADNRCRYRSYFKLSGWISPLVALLLGVQLRHGFEQMSQAVKIEAERLPT